MSWRADAPCLGATTIFYEGVFRDEDDPTAIDPVGLAVAQEICASCPVRRDCAVHQAAEDAGKSVAERDGFTAYMTPAQRWSVERRGTLRCKCGYVRDPVDLVNGRLECKRCKIDLTVPVIEPDGDRWAKRHTTIARKLIGWMIDNTHVGDELPSPSKMTDTLGASLHDVMRVYDGLVADGTLTSKSVRQDGSRPTYTRVGSIGAADSWYCPYLNN